MAQLFRTKYSLAGIFLGSYNLTHGVGGLNWPPENGHHEVCYFDLVEAV